MNIKYRHSCRICGNPHLTAVIDLGEQFFQGSFIKAGVPNPPSRKAPNLVVRCDTSKFENACGLIQTKHTIPACILYTNYWYQSGVSLTMRRHLQSVVEEALEITGLTGGSVLDIASNDNTLLRNYPSGFSKVGVDPSDIARRQTDADITVINDVFPTHLLSGGEFDIVTSIACYYDVEDPLDFASKVKGLLSPDGIWIFEVAYWPSILKNLSYDSIVNEHIIHYHLAPLETMFRSVRLKIFNTIQTATNGGSIKVYVCHDRCFKYDTQKNKDHVNAVKMEEFDAALDEEQTYVNFRNRVSAQRTELVALIKRIKEEGKTIHIYGASTKLNTILGFCGIDSKTIEFASERCSEKWGAKTISGIKLIPEEESREMKPDYYLVGPYHFKEEILEREKKCRENGTKFIFPLPKLTII